MNKKYLLSICIPTYNRDKYIVNLIENILKQSWFNNEEIEICITDNASTDNTENLIKDYQKKINNISYYKNSENLWMTANFLKAIENWNWEYCWIFWSDDIMTKDALSETLENIKKYKPWLILSDRFVFSEEKEIEKLNIDTNKKNIVLDWVIDFFNFIWNDNKINWAMNWNFFTFISIFCIKKDLYIENKEKFLKKYTKYNKLNYNYFNFALIVFFWNYNNKIIIIKKKFLVLARWWNHWWSFKSLEIFNDMYYMVNIFKKENNISFKCNVFFNHMLLWWFLPSVMWIIKHNNILKHLYPILMFIYNPLSKIVNKIFKLFS